MKVLIYFDRFTDRIGGSEFLPLTLVHEFQSRGDEVTLALNASSDVEKAQRQYGVSLDMEALQVVILDPENRFEWWMNRLFRCERMRKLRKIAKGFDLCISTLNLVDFGRPAVHFIYLLTYLTLPFRRSLGLPDPPASGGNTCVHRLWRKLTSVIVQCVIVHERTVEEMLKDPRERVYPNSNWAKEKIEHFFGCHTKSVFYPPTLLEASPCPSLLREDMVVSIGRIDPLKQIEFQISAMEEVRKRTHRDLLFVIAGMIEKTAYGRMIRKLAAERPWVKLVGPIYGEEKSRLLSTAKFALHTTTLEAFGISVSEYLKFGLIPLVPDTGGAAEVVGMSELQYHDFEDVVTKLSCLVSEPALYDELQTKCSCRAAFFSADNYWKRQEELVSLMVKQNGL